MSRSLHTNRDFEKLEPYEGKPSRTVLRGEEGSNALDLPDKNKYTLEIQGDLFDFADDRSHVDFHGNVCEYSAVFHYRIYSRELFGHIINQLRTVKRYHAWHKRREIR